jgi:hypothetical protein
MLLRESQTLTQFLKRWEKVIEVGYASSERTQELKDVFHCELLGLLTNAVEDSINPAKRYAQISEIKGLTREMMLKYPAEEDTKPLGGGPAEAK